LRHRPLLRVLLVLLSRRRFRPPPSGTRGRRGSPNELRPLLGAPEQLAWNEGDHGSEAGKKAVACAELFTGDEIDPNERRAEIVGIPNARNEADEDARSRVDPALPGGSVRIIEEGIILSEDDFPDGYERVIGSGLNLEFSGPWGTFVTVRIGAALNSTIPDQGSGADMRVVFFKTWDKWSRHGGKGTPPSGPPAAPGPMQPDPVPIDPDR
jgi:hypothetical protein